jgi:hypothetical protein
LKLLPAQFFLLYEQDFPTGIAGAGIAGAGSNFKPFWQECELNRAWIVGPCNRLWAQIIFFGK